MSTFHKDFISYGYNNILMKGILIFYQNPMMKLGLGL